MVMANIGSIVLSLPEHLHSLSVVVRSEHMSTQVRLISLSNTISRLVTGPCADFLAPVLQESSEAPRGKPRLSRMVFLLIPGLIITLVGLVMEWAVFVQKTLWVLRFVRCPFSHMKFI